MNKILVLILSSFILFSCNNEKTETKKATEVKVSQNGCLYSINHDAVKFGWTAFKTSAKVGVKGTFGEVEIQNDNQSVNIANLIANTEFRIHLSSLNSGNEDRDAKITKLFFGKLSNDSEFVGTIQDVTGNNENGDALILLSINDIENIVQMKYEVVDNLLKLSGNLDLLKWETKNSFDALNKACYDLHKGADGVSKTWTDVSIEVYTPLNKECK